MILYDKNGNEILDYPVVQSCYATELADTIVKARGLITEPCLVFPVVTDIHRYSSAPQTFDKMIANVTRFCENVKCDFLANLGDLIDGNTTQANSLSYAYDAAKKFQRIGVPYLFVEGNHDNNPYNSAGSLQGDVFDISQVFKAFYAGVQGVDFHIAENGTDWFIDFHGLGVRVVGLNACNVKKAKNYAYGDTTATWLANVALDTDYTVLLLEHLTSTASQVWNNCHGTNATNVNNALKAFVNGGGELVNLSGHSHLDLAFVTPWLSVMFAAQKFENFSPTSAGYQAISGYIDVMGNPSRTQETASEDCWTVCILKPHSMELDTIRFGAGVDRYFHYDPIAPTTLTSRLSGVTWSSSDTGVATVSGGVVTGVASGTCAILAKDSAGNYEAWTVKVT